MLSSTVSLAQRLGELEGADHPTSGHLVRGEPGQWHPVEGPPTGIGPVESGEQVEQRRLACTIRTDQRR